MYCSKCGAEYSDGDKFCKECGIELHDIENKKGNIFNKIIKQHNPLIKFGVILLTVILVVSLIGITNKVSVPKGKIVSTQGNNDKEIKKPAIIEDNAKVTEIPTSTEETNSNNIKNTENPPVVANTQIDSITSDEQWTNLYKGGLIEAADGGTYEPKKLIAINKSLMVAVNSFKTSIDESSFSNGKYYLIVDFIITDVSKKDYYSTMYNFTLSDALGYSYNPFVSYNTTGSLEGLIKSKGIIRGEVAFQVLGNQSKFVLHFRTKAGLDPSSNFEIINFKMDINDLKKTAPVEPNISSSDG